MGLYLFYVSVPCLPLLLHPQHAGAEEIFEVVVLEADAAAGEAGAELFVGEVVVSALNEKIFEKGVTPRSLEVGVFAQGIFAVEIPYIEAETQCVVEEIEVRSGPEGVFHQPDPERDVREPAAEFGIDL